MALHIHRGPFTVDAYQRLGELGVLPHGARVELIDGQVVEMTPSGDDHASCVRRLNHLLARAAGGRAIVDVQNPVVLGPYDAPQPDLALLRPQADLYPRHPRPGDVILAIEVADTSLAYDRDVKIPRYAAAGIPEIWLVDLGADTVGVYRRPGPDGYSEVVMHGRGETLRPHLLAGIAVLADEVLG
ncbi:MAG: Uma2 family endonuclease [Deltaproteobacteria bacterium]|nr:Uma2 family endonuclease [Deltaproteobacteria bacterium]